jgi:sugar lactone lactonase YvrE
MVAARIGGIRNPCPIQGDQSAKLRHDPAKPGGDLMKPVLRYLSFTEAPRWHKDRLWFSDFYTHRVIAVDPAGTAETIVTVPQQPSGLGWCPDGSLLIVSMLDRKLMQFSGGALAPFADISGLAGGPCNDMVVDAKGRAYVGNFGFDRYAGEAERSATLAFVDLDGTVSAAADGLQFPNGTVITPDGRGMIIGETVGQRLTWFDIAPDGAIWVADARGSELLRVLGGGTITDRVALPAGRHAFACMLGGADRRDLYVCTAEGSGPVMAAKLTAGIDVVRVSVPGAGLP